MQVIGTRRQSDIVDDQRASCSGMTSRSFSIGLEYRLGALDAGAGGGADVKLNLAAVDEPGGSRGHKMDTSPRRG